MIALNLNIFFALANFYFYSQNGSGFSLFAGLLSTAGAVIAYKRIK